MINQDHAALAEMTTPVLCAHCRQIYDLGTVEITARYADATVWISPCCSIQVDDRGEYGWTSISHYRKLTAEEINGWQNPFQRIYPHWHTNF